MSKGKKAGIPYINGSYKPEGEFLDGVKDPGFESFEGFKNEFGLDRGLSRSDDALDALGIFGGAQKLSKLGRDGLENSCCIDDCCWILELG